MLSKTVVLFAGAVALLATCVTKSAFAQSAPNTTITYQPMVSTGLAANNPFEAWFIFDKSSDPRVMGYTIPAGATIRFEFPQSFTPRADLFQGAVMLQGWVQGPIPAKFTSTLDPNDARVLVLKFNAAITASSAESPGLKAIHLRVPVVNPAAGDYPVRITFADAGELSGSTKAIAHIDPTPLPNIAAYNDLNGGKGSNWQHLKPGAEAAIPIDFLVTLPEVPRSVITLKSLPDNTLSILSDGKPIGSIKARGVPFSMTPEAFGPGKSRLGIIRVHVKAGNQSGQGDIIATLEGGTGYTINLVVDPASTPVR